MKPSKFPKTLFLLAGLSLVSVPLIAQPRAPDIPIILVQGGTFAMGARTLDPASPGRQVTVSSFYLGQTVVTQGQYQAVTGKNPSRFLGELLPVERVSWYDAVQFCNQLSALDGYQPAYTIHGTQVTWNQKANGWRLPTEAEFEFAARGGLKSKGYAFAGSNVANEVAIHFYDSGGRTHPVKGLAPNELGLYGMCGNVWEWCWDWFTPDLSSLPSVNPIGPAQGTDRVNRGGSWNDDFDDALRPYYRADDGPGTKESEMGFRLARNAPN